MYVDAFNVVTLKQLSDEERERYDNMAKEHKRRMRGQPGDNIRMDNQGNIIAVCSLLQISQNIAAVVLSVL